MGEPNVAVGPPSVLARPISSVLLGLSTSVSLATTLMVTALFSPVEPTSSLVVGSSFAPLMLTVMVWAKPPAVMITNVSVSGMLPSCRAFTRGLVSSGV